MDTAGGGGQTLSKIAKIGQITEAIEIMEGKGNAKDKSLANASYQMQNTKMQKNMTLQNSDYQNSSQQNRNQNEIQQNSSYQNAKWQNEIQQNDRQNNIHQEAKTKIYENESQNRKQYMESAENESKEEMLQNTKMQNHENANRENKDEIHSKISQKIYHETCEIPFHFHILTDSMTKDTREKLKDFEASLNRLYPCKFSFYEVSDSVFQGLPKLNGNYLAYFRLKMASCLPKDIITCLYLDVDMLCVEDIRSVFTIDLGEKVLGVVLDADFSPSRIMECRNNGNEKFETEKSQEKIEEKNKNGYPLNVETYFNSGFMLINLLKWRKENVEKLAFEWLRAYTPKWYDQDTLNAILSDRIKILPLEWNFMISHVENRDESNFKDGKNPCIAYTHEEYLRAKESVKILHFLTTRKPWHAKSFENGKIVEYPYRDLWWQMALRTPIFYKDLQALYMLLQDEVFKSYMGKQEEVIAKHTEQIYYLRKPHKRLLQSVKKIAKKLMGKKI